MDPRYATAEIQTHVSWDAATRDTLMQAAAATITLFFLQNNEKSKKL